MSSLKLKFSQVDVFSERRCFGNPLAVIHDADDLSPAQMQQIASWTNLSETVFLLRPTKASADYRIRIFTPRVELPFAGHPTLGACAAWLAAAAEPTKRMDMVQECAKGLVRLRRNMAEASQGHEDLRFDLAFEAPALKISGIDDQTRIAFCEALGIGSDDLLDCAKLDNGPVWYAFWIKSHAGLMGLKPDHVKLSTLGKAGVAAPLASAQKTRADLRPAAIRPGQAADSSDHASALGPPAIPGIAVRAFAAALGVNEDPVTGSLNAALAQWLMGKASLPKHYQALQGQALGREGLIDLRLGSSEQLWVGGCSKLVIQGHMLVDAD